MSTAECGGPHGGGKGGGRRYTDSFERMQKIEDRERESQFSEDLQTPMSKIKIKDPGISVTGPL